MIPWTDATNILEKIVGTLLLEAWRPYRLRNLSLAAELANQCCQHKQARKPWCQPAHNHLSVKEHLRFEPDFDISEERRPEMLGCKRHRSWLVTQRCWRRFVASSSPVGSAR